MAFIVGALAPPCPCHVARFDSSVFDPFGRLLDIVPYTLRIPKGSGLPRTSLGRTSENNPSVSLGEQIILGGADLRRMAPLTVMHQA